MVSSSCPGTTGKVQAAMRRAEVAERSTNHEARSRTCRRTDLYADHNLLARTLIYWIGRTLLLCPTVTLRCILVTNTESHFAMLDVQTVNTSDR